MHALKPLAVCFIFAFGSAQAEQMSAAAKYGAQVEAEIRGVEIFRQDESRRARAQRILAMRAALELQIRNSKDPAITAALRPMLMSLADMRMRLKTGETVDPLQIDLLVQDANCALQGILGNWGGSICGERDVVVPRAASSTLTANVNSVARTPDHSRRVQKPSALRPVWVQSLQVPRMRPTAVATETQEPRSPAKNQVPTYDEHRVRYVVSLYGHSVDSDLGRMLARLAETAPEVLRPIPIDRTFWRSRCVNKGLSPVIVRDRPNDADRAFRDMLDEASNLWDSGTRQVRFTLVSDTLAEKRSRTGVTVPDTLADFELEDAHRLITADFELRYGLLSGADPALRDALRNLEIALGAEEFLNVMARAVGPDSFLAPSQLGSALAQTNGTTRSLWSRVLREAGANLNCNDADKALEAYGLVYRRGDYPSARATMKSLKKHTGYDAIPSITVLKSEHEVTESQPQNCARFGPYRRYLPDADRDFCNLGAIRVDGMTQHRVLAGGVDVEFLATDEDRSKIRSVMYELEDIDRSGDKLRWHDTSLLGTQTQARSFVNVDLTEAAPGKQFPCVINLSKGDQLSNLDGIKTHVENYRTSFYPTGTMAGPNELHYVFVIDAFQAHQNPEVKSRLMETAQSLQSQLKSFGQAFEDEILGTQEENNDKLIGANALPFDWSNVCQLVNQQFADVSALNAPLSHGEFIMGLLLGGSDRADGHFGLGLLNPQGEWAAGLFENKVRGWSVYDKRTGLVSSERMLNHVKGSKERIYDVIEDAEEDGGHAPAPAIINISLSESYLHIGDEHAKRDAQRLIERLLEQMGQVGDKGLFVVAAGQAVRQSADAASPGKYLQFTQARKADVQDAECDYFPACLSDRKNVITVGAIKPSASAAGHARPIMIRWANHGSAVTLAAPGQAILGADQGFTLDEGSDRLTALKTESLRDGTSVATVFVTGIAAQLAARYPDLRASQLKKRLVSTARPYWTPDNGNASELMVGYKAARRDEVARQGMLFAGVIDPEAALRNPYKYQVTYRKGPHRGTTRSFERIELQVGVERHPKLTVFNSTSSSATSHKQCPWHEMYRIHITGASERDDSEPGAPIFDGAMACQDRDTGEKVSVASGPFGTRNRQHNPCLVTDTCLQGQLEDGFWEPLKFSEISDIYFSVVK
ncbi:S8 family serine peptidase [Roseovarius sp. M141]|uniref:S8 family serine peptidase n=1 Tax=Roseovarius sp. M141 TaxID=2583806 RepID=UPI0020CD35B5|nr:S8 family serine peptidase [Roseovarius sp. M141]MCQ0093422.1 S8 family peptidase [Roseovarius sp. M141]